jgi:putative NIF3 family GTP cyclohydrolase 1 type 2
MKPDGIGTGMVNMLGWKEYMVNGSLSRFKIPNTTLENLLGELKNKFPKHAFHVVGNPSTIVSGIAFDAGAPGSARHIKDLSNKDVDVLIAGESQQWETYEYARDAVMQGKNKALVFIGHINSEEAGMEYCATWLKSFITDVPVYFVSSGPSFWTY